MRRKRKRIKNAILKAITWFMGTVCALSAFSLDNEPYQMPVILLIVSAGWLVVFGLANGWFEVDKPERWDI